MSDLKERISRCDISDSSCRQASIDLIERIREEFPLGMVVQVEIGLSLIRLRITGHSSSWYHEPAYVYGINIDTGKDRKFHYTRIRGIIRMPDGSTPIAQPQGGE